MARYIDLEELIKRIRDNVLSDDNATPYEMDLVEWCKDECIRQGYAMPAADVAPKSEVAREIVTDIADLMWQGEDEKLNISLGGRYYSKQEFIAELKKKYTEEKE